ncbi:unnamed protein product, partial [Rhizoctonia solani]
MKKLHDTNTAFRHIPTEYDSCALGRDDPVWPRYINEATKWDAQLVEGWNKGMDVILLFAALFSAIVTTFLMEGYKRLQVDNEEIIATGMPIIVNLLQAIATNQIPSTDLNATITFNDFKPKRADVAINAAWFLSLTLSVSVALLVMLVKQWGEGYRHGHDLSPPCVQARVRQARYDKLKRWRTEDIALALPVLMHTALGLFLLGLVIFLYELNHTILALVLVVVVSTFVVYLGTTLMPLFIAFCPYDTPLSSRRYWARFRYIIYQVFGLVDEHGPGRSVASLKCQREERSISESTKPDRLTVRALEWLIGHSQDKTSIDIAIRAIASTALEAQLCKYLGQDSLITLLAQKFTAIFNGALEEKEYDSSVIILEDAQLRKAELYGQALANITRHIRMRIVSQEDLQYSIAEHQVDSEAALITLREDQVIAVERGLFSIASSKDPAVASSGVTCLSAWYTSTGRSIQSREKWSAMLTQLIELLSRTGHRKREYSESRSRAPNQAQLEQITQDEKFLAEDTGTSVSATNLGCDVIDRIVISLLFELAYWRWDLSKQEKQEILSPLIGLFSSPLLDGPSRPGMSAVLAIMGILFNEHQEILTEVSPTVEENWIYIPDIDPKMDNAGQPVYKETYSHPIHASRVKNRSLLVLHTARICQEDPNYMPKNADGLLYLGLAGLLDSIPMLGLGELTHQIVKIVTTQLNAMPVIFHSGPILLPSILPSTIDLRSFMADAVTRCLNSSPFKSPLHPFPDEEKAALLECIWEKGYLWSEFGHQFLVPTLQLLDSTGTSQLQDQCLNALNEYFFANANPEHININA